MAGPFLMVELRFPDGSTKFLMATALEPMQQAEQTIRDKLRDGRFGRARDLRRVITYEKLKGTLHDVIYSMEAAQIDFYPYQFKPVMKIVNSPTERLILADEVGLGKTIESALIWTELQARRQAKRLLVVCPKTLAEKWRDELRHKFLLDARVVGFSDLRQEILELHQQGRNHAFTLIATYTGLRPPRSELRLLSRPPDNEEKGCAKTEFLRALLHNTWDYDPFDLVIFDEAHYMRNAGTTTFHLGEALATRAGAVLCVSATPVNNDNTDLHSLLRLIDEDFFESQGMFEQLLETNRPAVQASNALGRIPIDDSLLSRSVEEMGHSQFIQNTPLYKIFLERVKQLDRTNKADLAKCQSLVESLNLLGGYINRTRRVQVKEHRPLREAMVLQVVYSPEEMMLYQTILSLVRARCRRDSRPFHVFQVLGLQLRAASCLPTIAREIEQGRFGDPMDLLGEVFGGESYDDLFDDDLEEELAASGLQRLLDYDFERNDSKYRELHQLLTEQIIDEKVVIFAYYRPTLAYLARRLHADGITVTVIHGGVDNEERWVRIDKFREPHGPRILLSSEVGSEGIDLQFSRVVINYDLPWNPMRVEQRIGRIDRVGQQAQKLAIVNFKVRDTVEERLYERLHEKLARFANSLGDLEAVIGREVQQLTVDLLSQDLSPEQEQLRIQQSESVIENRLLTIQSLEESGDTLIALSDYLQRQIDEVRGKGRYMQPEELEDYLTDFFERQFEGCEINFNTPTEGCLHINLTPEAHTSLGAALFNDRSLSARPFRQREFNISFRREVMQRLSPNLKRLVHFTNHMSPLIRWITAKNQEGTHSFFNVSAISLEKTNLEPGVYCYVIERWSMKGLSLRERLAYSIASLANAATRDSGTAEDIIQQLLHYGKDWDYPTYDKERLLEVHDIIENNLFLRFKEAVAEFHAENITALQIREQRVRSFYDRRIAQDEQRLKTLLAEKPGSPAIRAAEGRLNAAKTNKDMKLRDLHQRAEIKDMVQKPIAAGVFLVC